MKGVLAASLAVLAGLAVGQRDSAIDCPTAVVTRFERGCRKQCQYRDCDVTFTLTNSCGCPSRIPKATLILGCDSDEDCPYGGCSPAFASVQPNCSPASPTWPPVITTTITTRVTSTSSPTVSTGITTLPTTKSTPTPTSSPTVSTGITILPPKSTPCPTVDKTTYPADCSALRCPVPTCLEQQTIRLPCTCSVHTRLFVQGCPTACPDGCATRIQTSSAVC
ncbi:hypothetical protein GQ53DRAFT_401534 [Thozetella sp. PMI_491]|nr:hypothetical protein GQ53DRAFT_401534 [Thozetella sp. PMI_491]